MKKLLLAAVCMTALHTLQAQTITIYRSGAPLSTTYSDVASALSSSVGGDSLVFSADTFRGKVNTVIGSGMILQGTIGSSRRTVIDADSDWCFSIPGGFVPVNVTLRDIAITNAMSATNGPAIHMGANATLLLDGQTRLYNCMAGSYSPAGGYATGGAIYSEGTVTIKGRTKLDNNKADDAGALYSGGQLTVLDSVIFSGNEVSNNGAAIICNGPGSFNGTVFTGNIAEGVGGAISTQAATTAALVLTNCSLTGNKSNNTGSALYVDALTGTVEIKGSNIEGNRGGNAIVSWDADVLVRESNISGNRSGDPTDTIGIGIYTGSADVTVAMSRLFNPMDDGHRQSEVYVYSGGLKSDTTWWGQSDLSGLISNRVGTVTVSSWVIANWTINGGTPVTTEESFPVEALFTLDDGSPLPARKPYAFLMGRFQTTAGSFTPDSSFISSGNIIRSDYFVPSASTTISLLGRVDADSVQWSGKVIGLGIFDPHRDEQPYTLYPNPGNGRFFIQQLNGAGSATIEVRNLLGQTVYSGTLHFAQGIATFEVPKGNWQGIAVLTDQSGKRTTIPLQIQ